MENRFPDSRWLAARAVKYNDVTIFADVAPIYNNLRVGNSLETIFLGSRITWVLFRK